MKKPLKIAVLVKSFSMNGGMEKYAVEVVRRLRDRGHNIDVFTREADEKRCKGIKVNYLPFRYRFSSVLSAMALAADYEKALAGKTYDIIHSHERAYCQDVLTNHCFTYKGSLSNYPLLRRLDQLLLSPRTWMYLYLEGRQMQTKNLVGVSGAIKNDIYDHYQRSDVEVIMPGVDCDRFHPETVIKKRDKVRNLLGVNENEKVVVFVGSEFTRKGLEYLLPVTANGGVRLVVVGRGDSLPKYQKLVESLGTGERLSFVGLVDNVEDYYAASDLVVLPSNSEAFGMSILEAMACGRTVLASDNCGVSSLIVDGKNGFLLKDKQQTVKEALRILDTDTKMVGNEARKTAESLSWDVVTTQYESLFYQATKQKFH